MLREQPSAFQRHHPVGAPRAHLHEAPKDASNRMQGTYARLHSTYTWSCPYCASCINDPDMPGFQRCLLTQISRKPVQTIQTFGVPAPFGEKDTLWSQHLNIKRTSGSLILKDRDKTPFQADPLAAHNKNGAMSLNKFVGFSNVKVADAPKHSKH